MSIFALGAVAPQIAESAWVAPNATVIGDVVLGERARWWNAVLRADNAQIAIGAESNIQDSAVLHVDADTPITLGERVSIAHQVMLHGCTIGDNSLIGMGATILNCAVIGKNCIVGAGSLGAGRQGLSGWRHDSRHPGKRVVRPLREDELAYLAHPSSHYVENAARYGANWKKSAEWPEIKRGTKSAFSALAGEMLRPRSPD